MYYHDEIKLKINQFLMLAYGWNLVEYESCNNINLTLLQCQGRKLPQHKIVMLKQCQIITLKICQIGKLKLCQIVSLK